MWIEAWQPKDIQKVFLEIKQEIKKIIPNPTKEEIEEKGLGAWF